MFVVCMHDFVEMRGFGGCERFRIITAVVLNHIQTFQKTTTEDFNYSHMTNENRSNKAIHSIND